MTYQIEIVVAMDGGGDNDAESIYIGHNRCDGKLLGRFDYVFNFIISISHA